MADGRSILFVYNADAGLGHALIDAAHKFVSPSTYACSLCAITYGAVAMRSEWRTALERLSWPTRFLHRDEFRREWPDVAAPLPAVLLANNALPLETLIDAAALNEMSNVAELVAALDRSLAARL